MRAYRVANRIGYSLFLRNCSGLKLGFGVVTVQCPANAIGRPVTVARELRTTLRIPENDQVKVMESWEGPSLTVEGSILSRVFMALLSPVAFAHRIVPTTCQELLYKSIASVPRRTFRSVSHPLCSASVSVQDVVNFSTVADLNQTVREAAIPALKEYIRDVKGAADEEAEIISRNCPIFIQTMTEFVTKRILENGDTETLQSCIRFFLDMADKQSSSDSTCINGKVSGVESKDRLSKFPLRFAGNNRWKHMAVLEPLGCSRSKVWETLERNPELLTLDAEELQARISVLEGVGVKKKDMLTLVEDSAVFSVDLEERLAPMLQYLDAIGIERHVLGDLMKFNPQGLIKMPLANLRERVDFLLELGLSSSEVERSMRVFPQLVHLRLTNLSQKIEYFDGIGVDRKSLVKIVAKLPSIFRHSIDKNLVPKVQMLENLGVRGSSRAKFISQYPQFFGCSMENLKQKLVFFERNGLTGDRLVKMITWHPRAFSFSVEENLSKKLDFLVSKGFVLGSTAMVRALASCITISTISLDSRFQNLQSLGFTPEEVSELVRKQPTIFCLSEKTIRMKADYLVDTMRRSSREILKCPGYLLYSLELRIKPRYRVVAMLTSRGLLREEAYSLSTILQPSEKNFVKRFLSLHPECLEVYYGIERTDEKNTSNVPQLAVLDPVTETEVKGVNARN